jgi:CO2 hydration protein
MVSSLAPSRHPLAATIHRLEAGEALLRDSGDPQLMLEICGVLLSYGVVLDAYSTNLCYIAQQQFLNPLPFFKYFDGAITPGKFLKHLNHDRINFEYAEYCMKAMLWHGGGGLDAYLDTPEFAALAEAAIRAKIAGNPLMQGLHRLFPDFLPEQVRQSAYYQGLGLFWRVMSDIFLTLWEGYEARTIRTVGDVVTHILDGLVTAAANPVTLTVEIGGQSYDILPASANLTFLMDTAVPYVEAVFFRGTPFSGTVSYNAQAGQIPEDQAGFQYGALYADPLPIGGAGIPPTLLMQDMIHFLPKDLDDYYHAHSRGERDLRVQICESFQKSMFCVTTAAIKGLAPAPMPTDDPELQQQNRAYLEGWMDRFIPSRIAQVNQPAAV